MKVILIQGLLAPYRYPIFEELAKTPGWDFEVWFMGRRVKNRIWDEEAITQYHFNHVFLQGLTLNFGTKDIYPIWFNFSIYAQLAEAKPDVVIMMGWDSLTSFLVHLYCSFSGTKFVLYSDSTPLEKSWRRIVTLPLVKLHVVTADALISGGTRSKEYLQILGADPKRIHVSFNTVDVEKYQQKTAFFQKKRNETLKKLQLENKKIILYYGQMIERKGVDLLLSAYQRLKKNNPDIALLLIGDGPLKEKLSSKIQKESILDAVLLSNPGDEEICRYYALASVFVLPSREDVWGLVVNEAMSAGVPVVVSDHAGCAPDLVSDGQEGYVFASENIHDLSEKIMKVIENNSFQKKMAQKSLEKIQLFNPRKTITEFQSAVKYVSPFTNIFFNFLQKPRKNFISVIIPEYKDEAGLQKTLDSLNAQKDAPDFEVIVEHDTQGEGSYQTRNKALQKVHGEYIAFIDAGTTASSGWLKQGFQSLQKYDYVGGPVERVNAEASNLFSATVLFGRHREFAVQEFFQDLHFFPTTNLFMKRTIFEKLGGFEGRLRSSGDYEFGERVFSSGNFTQHYDPDLTVTHPFRSYLELVQKQRRIAQGNMDLKKYFPSRFGSWRKSLLLAPVKACIPPLWLLKKPSYQSLNFWEKLQVFLVTYHLSFLHSVETIRYGCFRGQ